MNTIKPVYVRNNIVNIAICICGSKKSFKKFFFINEYNKTSVCEEQYREYSSLY